MVSFVAPALALVTVAAFAAAIAGWDRGWAFADRSMTPPGGKDPAMIIELELGWWNSTTHITSGWVPGSAEVSGKASQAVGVITVVALTLGALVGVHILLLALCDAIGVTMPKSLTLPPAQRYKAAGLFGLVTLVLTVVLYLWLMLGAHNEIRHKFGDDASVWPRPDWASGCALLGSVALMGLAQQLSHAGYEPVGYMPI